MPAFTQLFIVNSFTFSITTTTMASVQVGGSSNDTVITSSKLESNSQEKHKDDKNKDNMADEPNVSSDTQNTSNENESKVDNMEEKIGNCEDNINDKFLKVLDNIPQTKNKQDLYRRFEANKTVLIDESEGGGGFQGVFAIVVDAQFVDCKSDAINN